MTVTAGYSERSKQRACVSGELLEGVLVVRGFRRFAEPDLVGGNDAKARFGEDRDGVFPGRRAEILAVQEHDGAAVRRRRLHVHVRHLHASPCEVKEKCATGRGYSNPSSRGPYAGSSSAAGAGPAAADATPRQSTDRRSTEQRITHLPMIEFPRPDS